MDFQISFLLIAAASLATGVALCWLALRGRIAAAAARGKSEARSALQAELLAAQKRVQSLDGEQLLALENYDKLNLQASQWRDELEQARDAHAQLVDRAARVELLEAKLLALQEQEKASQQELQLLSTSDSESVEALKRVSARLAQLEDEDAALERDLAATSAQAGQASEAPAPPEAQATQLPVLELEVIALQSMAKTIQQEFAVLLDVQRRFTAASSALQDVS